MTNNILDDKKHMPFQVALAALFGWFVWYVWAFNFSSHDKKHLQSQPFILQLNMTHAELMSTC